jgi:hypothetical protein
MTMAPRHSAKWILPGIVGLLAMLAAAGSAGAAGSNGGSHPAHRFPHHGNFNRFNNAAIFDEGLCCGPFFDSGYNNPPSVIVVNGTRYVALPPELPARPRPAELKFSSETVHDVEITRGPPSAR